MIPTHAQVARTWDRCKDFVRAGIQDTEAARCEMGVQQFLERQTSRPCVAFHHQSRETDETGQTHDMYDVLGMTLAILSPPRLQGCRVETYRTSKLRLWKQLANACLAQYPKLYDFFSGAPNDKHCSSTIDTQIHMLRANWQSPHAVNQCTLTQHES